MADVNFNANSTTSAAATIAAMGGVVVSIQASSLTATTAVMLSLGGGAANLNGEATSSCDAQISSLGGGSVPLDGNAITGASASISSMTGGAVFLQGYSASAMSAVMDVVGGSSAPLQGASTSSFTATINLTGASDSHGMSICHVIHEVVMLWGIDCLKSAPNFALERAMTDLNAALQMVWNQAKDRTYWTSETLSLNLLLDETSIDLPNDIQNVTGPLRRADNKRPLTPVGTMGELETFSDLYLEGTIPTEPVAYHIDRMKQAGNDPARCVLHVTPEVHEASIDFLLDVVKEAPRFTLADLDTCPLVPIPHQYVETLLLPIVRYRASGFTLLFNSQDRQETIDREYQEARIALGLADPLPGNAGDNQPKPEPSK